MTEVRGQKIDDRKKIVICYWLFVIGDSCQCKIYLGHGTRGRKQRFSIADFRIK
jgi:hypothetical protein